MKAKWHRYKHGWGYEHVLFVGVWEWRVSAIPEDWQVERVFGIAARWRATGPGLEGGNPTSPGTVLTETLPQAKQRCADAALRCLESCVADKRASASDAWLQQAVRMRTKRGEARMIAVEWTESKHPSKIQQQQAKATWDVVVRDWHGYEFCRRAWPTEEAAQKSEAELKAKLMGCNGDVLAALSAWSGHSVQVPLWWGG